MTGLSHEQTKRYLHVAADQCLNPVERAALDAHLADCASCRNYRQELEQLNGAISHALRVKWSAPYRSPIDMAGRVRKQLRTNAERQLFLGVTNVLVKLSSMAVGAALILSLINSPRALESTTEVASDSSAPTIISGLSPFELRDMQNAILPPSLLLSDKQPGTPSSRLRALPY